MELFIVEVKKPEWKEWRLVSAHASLDEAKAWLDNFLGQNSGFVGRIAVVECKPKLIGQVMG